MARKLPRRRNFLKESEVDKDQLLLTNTNKEIDRDHIDQVRVKTIPNPHIANRAAL